MFLDELSPFIQELFQQPVAFMGGVMSGFLRLNLGEEPLKSWLTKQTGVSPVASAESDASQGNNGSGPQTIAIE